MAQASGPRVAIRYIKEVTPGTTPATPTMTLMRTLQRNINLSKQLLESEEVRPDRNVPVQRHGFRQVGGSLGFEYAPKDFDDLIASALSGAWTTNVLKNGTTLDYYTIERGFEDVSKFQPFRGCAINEFSISCQPRQMVRGAFTILGMNAGAMANSTLANATTAPQYLDPFTAFEAALEIGGSPVAVCTGIDINIQNNRSVEAVVGADGSPAVYEGVFKVSGTATVFLEDATFYNLFEAETEVALELVLADLAGTSTHTILLPAVKFNGGDMDPPTSGPIPMTLPFMATYDTTEACSIKITRAYPA